MRMRLIIETDFVGTRASFREEIRNTMKLGWMTKCVPGEIVYVATDVAETAVISHNGKVLTQG